MPYKVNKVVIVGGGTSGWMAAATLAERYRQHNLRIELIESDQISAVGVGEATVPGLMRLHQNLGISEREFIKATNATFKLGIEFIDWHSIGQRFFHPFSAFGAPINGQPFYPCWLKSRDNGCAHELEAFSLSTAMARQGRFAQPNDEATNPLALYSYAYHFDATLYAQFLRKYAESRGVKRTEGKVTRVENHASTGAITGVQLQQGAFIEGDLFIDCTGFTGVLIKQNLGVDFDDWSHWLPCDRAVVVQTQNTSAPLPYTQSIAREAGWQWRIPLEQRKGNGLVYSSAYLSDDEAAGSLLKYVDGKLLTEPRQLRFKAGMRSVFWQYNCVALGLSGGFIEPLESTSISLIQTGLEKLMQSMPELEVTESAVAQANRLNRAEYERIRDFIILHYKASGRRDTAFWRDVSAMDVPDTLTEKMCAFADDGRILLGEQESFTEQSWIALFHGLGLRPQSLPVSMQQLDSQKLTRMIDGMAHSIALGAQCAPSHHEFLQTLD
ncbi:tryptophan halogenase family protein [Gilvimarinus japonicus]|uniref:Tryptophan halogenase family protein n=1 Tax=Gilvimarinus japonicus TaxID=1796469 RepID=A0ABV7HJN5_9GAMM